MMEFVMRRGRISRHDDNLPRQSSGLLKCIFLQEPMGGRRFGQGKRFADLYPQVFFLEPTVDIFGAMSPLVSRGIEDGEAIE